MNTLTIAFTITFLGNLFYAPLDAQVRLGPGWPNDYPVLNAQPYSFAGARPWPGANPVAFGPGARWQVEVQLVGATGAITTKVNGIDQATRQQSDLGEAWGNPIRPDGTRQFPLDPIGSGPAGFQALTYGAHYVYLSHRVTWVPPAPFVTHAVISGVTVSGMGSNFGSIPAGALTDFNLGHMTPLWPLYNGPQNVGYTPWFLVAPTGGP